MMISVISLKAEGEKKRSKLKFSCKYLIPGCKENEETKKIRFLRIFSDKLNINKPEPDYGKDTHFFS